MEIFIGRQPIFGDNENLFGYELLYRSDPNKNEYTAVDPNMATIDVIVNSFFSIGFDELSNGKPCFVNFTKELLFSNIFTSLSPKEVVVEILEDIPITPELIEKVKEIKQLGFRIALDDFMFQKDIKLYDELFQYIDFIKVDFILSNEMERYEIESYVFKSYPHITLLAEKVETRADYIEAKSLGYKLFQGYYFKQPQIIVGNEIPANVIQYYQIIALLKSNQPDINKLVEHIETDVALSYKILKIINSSSKKTKRKIRSIKQAILLLGLSDLQKWVYILAYREANRKKDLELFEELMKTSLCRAKLSELIAKKIGYRDYSESFLVGMFSLIDVLLERSMNSILGQLPLDDRIVNTLAGSKTELSAILQMAIALERFDWKTVKEYQYEIHLSVEELSELVQQANIWTSQLSLNGV